MSRWRCLLRDLVERRTGITILPDSLDEKRLLAHLDGRASELGLGSPTAFLLELEKESMTSPRWQGLVSRLTNGQTCFFRDPEQFDSIGGILKSMYEGLDSRSLHIWSSGCATGEEAYSLAILCRESRMDARVRATDINDEFLARAREALYDDWLLRRVGSKLRKRWFERFGEKERVVDEIRQMVVCEQHNMALDSPLYSDGVDGRWDLIVCSNVFLYFRRERMEKVCRRLARALLPSGALILSASESLHGLDVPLSPQRVGQRVVYRPICESPPPRASLDSRSCSWP